MQKNIEVLAWSHPRYKFSPNRWHESNPSQEPAPRSNWPSFSAFAKRRGRIPSDWLVAIMRAKNIHPEWILTGDGPCRMGDPLPLGRYETGDAAQERWAKEGALRRISSQDLADELLRRIAVAQADTFTR